MREKIIKFALVVVGLVLMLSILTCGVKDGALYVTGRVYEWVDAPEDAESLIYIDSPDVHEDLDENLDKLEESLPNNIEKQRLPKAIIEVGSKNSPIFEFTSDENGEIQDGSLVTPGLKDLYIRVTKNDYKEVVGEWKQTTGFYTFLVVLVKGASTISE